MAAFNFTPESLDIPSPIISTGDSKHYQPMCAVNYSASVTESFAFKLIPGTTLSIVSVFLNVVVIRVFGILGKATKRSNRASINFIVLAYTDILVGVAFAVAQFHAMTFQSYEDRILSFAKEPICRQNRTHFLHLLFTVYETSARSGHAIKGYSLVKYIFELINRFSNTYLAIDRTLMLCFPLGYGLQKQRTSDSKSVREFVLKAVVPAVVVSIVLIVILGTTSRLSFVYELYLMMVAALVVPLPPMIVSAVVISWKSRRARGGCCGSPSRQRPSLLLEQLDNMSQLTAAVVVCFLLLELPNFFFQGGLWLGLHAVSQASSPHYFLFGHLQHVSRMASSFVNFFIFFFMSTPFRTTALGVCRCWGGKERKGSGEEKVRMDFN